MLVDYGGQLADQVVSAENVKDLPGVGEIRASFLDTCPVFGESLRRARAELLQFRVNGNDPEVRTEGDPLRRLRLT